MSDNLQSGLFELRLRCALAEVEAVSDAVDAVDALSVSVKWSDQCLIGQAGPEIGEAVAVALPFLADGGCLIGATRPIDW